VRLSISTPFCGVEGLRPETDSSGEVCPLCVASFPQAKCTLGDETRLLHIGPSVSYAEMLEGVRAKFPDAPPFALKFLDRSVLFTPELPVLTRCEHPLGPPPGHKTL
jgi:hypothetical protein